MLGCKHQMCSISMLRWFFLFLSFFLVGIWEFRDDFCGLWRNCISTRKKEKNQRSFIKFNEAKKKKIKSSNSLVTGQFLLVTDQRFRLETSMAFINLSIYIFRMIRQQFSLVRCHHQKPGITLILSYRWIVVFCRFFPSSLKRFYLKSKESKPAIPTTQLTSLPLLWFSCLSLVRFRRK